MTYNIEEHPNHPSGFSKGKDAQQIICIANNVSVVLEQGKDNHWKEHYDFKTSDGLRYEVKANRKSIEYQTLFIETAQCIKKGEDWTSFKPSGLMIAKADFWMLWHGDVYLKIEQTKLKKTPDTEQEL